MISRQLLEALNQGSNEKLHEVNSDKTICEHLAFYNAHETCHADQLEIVRQSIDNRK